ncbi:MAG: glycosyltransferase family 39 protein [Lutibacter sp.]|nr:glycosyltransferase family 39 protein [Lutibacter sp.]
MLLEILDMNRFYNTIFKAKNKTYFKGINRLLFGKPYSLARVLAIHIVVGLLKLFYVMAGIQELDYEEVQYWTWSKHLDIWYYSKPPLIAYLNWFSTRLFGVHEWSVRLNAVFLSVLTAIAVYYLALKLYHSARLAYYSSILLLLFPGFVYVSMYFTTDAPLVLFWVLSCLYFWKAIKEENGMKNWLLTALFVGLGLLSKYALLFFYPISFLYLWRYHKEKLREKGYYLFVFLSLLFLIPFVIWNIRYNWVGLGHVAQLSGLFRPSNTFNFLKAILRQLEFLGGQVVMNLPLLLLLIFRAKYKEVKVISQEADRFLIFQVAMVFFMFFGLSFFKRVNINWLLFAYIPVYIVAARIFISQPFFKGLKIGFSIIAFLFTLFFLQPILATRDAPLSKVVSGKVDSNKKLRGWAELALVAEGNLGFPNNNSSMIFTESYRVASELSFYMDGNPDVFCLPVPDRKMHQFDIWGLPEKDSLINQRALLVTTKPMESYGWESPPDNLIRLDSLTLHYKKHPTGTYYFYLFNDFYKIEGIETTLKRN